MMVPLGALPGFSFKAECRFVAAFYGVAPRAIRQRAARDRGLVMEARHALMWRLQTEYGLDDRRIARLMDCDAATVRAGVAAHVERIAHFRTTINVRARRVRAARTEGETCA